MQFKAIYKIVLLFYPALFLYNFVIEIFFSRTRRNTSSSALSLAGQSNLSAQASQLATQSTPFPHTTQNSHHVPNFNQHNQQNFHQTNVNGKCLNVLTYYLLRTSLLIFKIFNWFNYKEKVLCKVYWASPIISMRLTWKRSHLTWHLGPITYIYHKIETLWHA